MDESNPPPGTVPTQPDKKYSAEQLAMLHAAMMEELGIGRLDSLALADKGPAIESLQPLQQPKMILSTQIAAWHNLHLTESADPTRENLDNIADGQLYRMRRGDSNARSRGNGAPRGGHFTHGDRGRGRGGRGENGYTGPGRQDNRTYNPSSTPKTFYQDANNDVRSSTHVDRVMLRLRNAMRGNSSTHRQSGHGPAAPPSTSRQSNSKTGARPATPVHSKPVRPSFKLDDGDAFLKWAGMDKSTTAKPPITPKVVVNGDSSHKSAPVVSANGVAVQAQVDLPAKSHGSNGLSGSKWGPSPQTPVQQQVVIAPHQPLKSGDAHTSKQNLPSQEVPTPQQVPTLQSLLSAQPHDSLLDGRKIQRRQLVKITNNNSPTKTDGEAVLTKEHADTMFTLILIDSLTGNVLLDEPISPDAVFEINGSMITYRAAQQTMKNPPTWKLLFTIPLYSISFASIVFLSRPAGQVARTASDMRHAQLTHHISPETPSYTAPEVTDESESQQQKNVDVNEHTQEILNEPQAQFYHGPDFDNVPASGTFAQESTSETVEMLISLGNDGETYFQPSTINPDVFDLLEADDSSVIVGLFAALGGDEIFFNNLNGAVVRVGGKPISEVSSTKLISDPFYVSILQSALAMYLSTTATFAMLPEDYCAAYVQHKASKVMELAISRRGPVLDSSFSGTSVSGVEDVEEKMSNISLTPHAGHKINAQFSTSVNSGSSMAGVDDSQRLDVLPETRTKYTPTSLLGLRDHAVPVEISAQPPRERRPTRVVTPHVTTAKDWQSFGAQDSKSSTPVPETRPIAPSVVPVHVQDVSKTVNRTPEASNRTTREAPPAVSTTNAWQAYAAAEESKSAAEDQDLSAASPATHAEIVKSLQEVKISAASTTTASVIATTPSTVVNPHQSQLADDARWATHLEAAGSSKKVIKPEPQVNKGTLRHRPSNSDINDRLAKSFSVLDLNTHVTVPAVQPTAPVFEKPLAVAQQASVGSESTPDPGLMSHGKLPLRSSTPASLADQQSLTAPQIDVKVQTTPETTLLPRGQSSARSSTSVAYSPAGHVMQDKINSALEQSRASSLTQKSSTGDPADSAKSQSKTEIDSDLPKSDHATIPEVKSKLEPVKSYGSTVALHAAVTEMRQNESSASCTVSVKSPSSSTSKVESVGSRKAAAAPAKSSRALDDTFTNVLKGAPGLSASKWADESVTPQFTRHPHPQTPISSFHPINQAAPYYLPGQQRNQIPTSAYAPVLATVVRQRADGIWEEITGMVKTGSFPLVAHAPIPQVGNPYVENVRPSNGHMEYSHHSTPSNLPGRPSTFQHHSSFGSVNLESKINPGAPTFKPSPQRPQASAPVEQRPALSPRRNTQSQIQSQLQSRLYSSMIGPRSSYQNPQL